MDSILDDIRSRFDAMSSVTVTTLCGHSDNHRFESSRDVPSFNWDGLFYSIESELPPPKTAVATTRQTSNNAPPTTTETSAKVTAALP